MTQFDKQSPSYSEINTSEADAGRQDHKSAQRAPSPAFRLLRGAGFESGTEYVRPKRQGDGYGGGSWVDNLIQSGKDKLADFVSAAQASSGPAETQAPGGAEAVSTLVVAPKSGWGTKIADVHGVDVRQNHPTSAAVLKQEIPSVDTSGGKYGTALRGQYGLMYQCVELVNRYYATRLGHQNMAKTGHARDYLGTGDRGLDTYKNPSKVKPQEGDLMVNTDLGSVGHVGIVKSVGASSMEVAQQNTSNPIATATLTQNGDTWTLGGGWDGFRRKPGTTPTVVADGGAAFTNTTGSTTALLLNLIPPDFVQRVKEAGSAVFESTVGILKHGDQGAKVEALQHRLVALNYMTAAEMATGPGIFGNKTLRALKAYQTDHGLAATGTLEMATFASLVGGQLESLADAAKQNSAHQGGDGTTPYHAELMADPLRQQAGNYGTADMAFSGLPASDRVKKTPQNQIGGFNANGKSMGKTYEVVNGKTGPYIREKSQQAKDQKAAGKNANKTAGSSPITNVEATGTLYQDGGKKSAATASGSTGWDFAGQPVTYEANAASYDYDVHAGVQLDDGVELNLGGAAGVSLVDGKLQYHYPTIPVVLWGEKFLIDVSCRVSAEVALRASGQLAVDAAKTPKGVVVGSGLQGELFAGGRAGFVLAVAAGWQSPEGAKDIVGGYAGAEGWIGAAASAGLVARLVPSVKFEGYLGAAAGIGAKVQAGVEAHLGNAAQLGYLLASRGLAEAWQGLEHCGAIVAEWLQSGAGALYQFGEYVVESVGNFLLGNAEVIATVNSGAYQYLGPKHQAKLIDQMVQGTCGNAEEQAILTILRHAKNKGQLYTVIALVPGGVDTLNDNLHYAEQDELNRLLGS
ncbi:MAG: CHAP domain-containing protein [Myxococcales bacterium]|nr:CHAP domain-containing protein [Myxococcales bacterium]